MRPDSFSVEAERECDGFHRFLHFACRQSRNAIADIALRHGLDVVEVCGAGVWQAVVLRKNDFCWDAADRRSDRCNGRLKFSTAIAELRVRSDLFFPDSLSPDFGIVPRE